MSIKISKKNSLRIIIRIKFPQKSNPRQIKNKIKVIKNKNIKNKKIKNKKIKNKKIKNKKIKNKNIKKKQIIKILTITKINHHNYYKTCFKIYFKVIIVIIVITMTL